MARTGEDRMRSLVRLICVLSTYPGLMAVISLGYPSVEVAIAALVAACSATNFDKIPEIQP